MPTRKVIAEELAEIFKLIAHPDRIRLIEELRLGEHGVNALAERLELRSPRVSQHLSLLKAHRLVEERRDGRHHYYKLSQPDLAAWIVSGLDFIEGRVSQVRGDDIASVRALWTGPADETLAPTTEGADVA